MSLFSSILMVTHPGIMTSWTFSKLVTTAWSMWQLGHGIMELLTCTGREKKYQLKTSLLLKSLQFLKTKQKNLFFFKITILSINVDIFVISPVQFHPLSTKHANIFESVCSKECGIGEFKVNTHLWWFGSSVFLCSAFPRWSGVLLDLCSVQGGAISIQWDCLQVLP